MPCAIMAYPPPGRPACPRSGGRPVIGAPGARPVGSGRGALCLSRLAPAGKAACRFEGRAGRGLWPARWLVATFGVDLGDVEDGDASAAEPDQSPFGVVAKHLGGGLTGGAGQGRDLLVSERDDR
jgi:hypothetical protein